MAEGVYDFVDEFNQRQRGLAQVRDPYTRLAKLRRECPVQRISLKEVMGEGMPVAPGMPDFIYSVLSHETVAYVLRDAETFSSAGYARSMGLVMGHTILEMDPPEHGRYRSLLQSAFSKKALDRWERELVKPVVHELMDRFTPRGSADLVRELTLPFPVSVIAGMIGLDPADHLPFHRMAVDLISIAMDPMRGMAASQGLRDLFARVLGERRKAPRDDLMTVLAQSELDGTRLDDDAIFAFFRLLAPAGAETTYRSSSNLIVALLTHPEQLEALRRDRSLMSQAIEEGLRWEAPLVSIMRTATREVELAGVRIPAGAAVSVNLAAANRDEARYPEPDKFDIFRQQRPHMAFAFGPHRCLGMHLARMETQVALNAILDRLPELRLDPAGGEVHITGATFRSPLAIPVRFAAS